MEAEDYALELFKSLNADQKKVAYQPKHFDEPGARLKKPKIEKTVGLVASQMSNAQNAILTNLLKSYTGRMPGEVAAAEMKQVEEAGMRNIFFAFTGSAEAGKGFTYRVQGPTFVVEFLNIQADSSKQKNPANHIHSCWRRINGDFGL